MFTVNGLVQFAHRYRARRAQARLARIIADLPRDVQRDIGWPALDMDSRGLTGRDHNLHNLHL